MRTSIVVLSAFLLSGCLIPRVQSEKKVSATEQAKAGVEVPSSER